MDNEAQLEQIRKVIKLAVAKEWVKQGHRLTGEFEREIEVRTRKTKNGINIDCLVLKRGKSLELGVGKEKIKINGAYIAGLIDYVRKRMQISDAKKAKSVAFAIAKTHQREGMPSKASKKYSSTGKRTGYINETIRNNAQEFEKVIKQYARAEIDIELDLLFRKWKKTFEIIK